MSNVDKRVVQMEFDNKQFEKDMQATVKSLQKFENDLQSVGSNNKAFDGVGKSLDNVKSNIKGFTLDSVSNAFEKVKVSISGWEMAAMAAITNVVNGAMNAAKNMAKSLISDPISQGFSEYELKMDSVQTMLMGAQAIDASVTLDDVNKKLDELNTYADKTIYSFSDMTQNIGKFINAGVGLDDAVAAIQGVSNVAAISGANANEASRAMYNFAQALSSGAVKLIDWHSIEYANMATVEFKQQLLDTALALGTVVKEGDYYISTTQDANGHISEAFTATSKFNESLNAQWMTTEVLTETLKKYTDETTELGKKAFDAAQTVKTFKQLMDTLKEAVGSGWAQTWEIVFGDFEKAKTLWTAINNVVGGFIDRQSKARNELLKNWAELGGRTTLLEALKNLFSNISNVINSIKQGFQDVFPAITAKKLLSLTRGFSAFVTKLEITKDELKEIRETFKSVFGSIYNVIAPIRKAWKEAFPVGTITGVVKKIISFIGSVIKSGTDLFNAITDNGNVIHNVAFTAFSVLKVLINILSFLFNIITNIIKVLSPIGTFIGKIIGYITTVVTEIGSLIFKSDKLRQSASKISETLGKLGALLKDVVIKAFEKLQPYLDAFKEWVKPIVVWIGDKLVKGFEILSGWVGTLYEKLKNLAGGFLFSGDGASKAGTKVEKYKEKVKDASNAVTTAIKKNETLNAIWEKVSGFFIKIWNGIKSVFEKMKPGFEAFGNKIKEIFSGIFKSFQDKGVGGGIGDTLGKIFGGIGKAFTVFIEHLGPIKQAILDFFGADSVIDLIKNFVSLFVKIKLTEALNKFGDGFKTISQSLNGFAAGIQQLTKLGQDNSKSFRNFAIGIGILIAAFFLITKIDGDKLLPSIIALTVILNVIAGIFIALNEITKNNEKASKNFTSMAVMLLAFGQSISKIILSMTALIAVINAIKNVGAVWLAIIIVTAIIGLIEVFTVFFASKSSKYGADAKQIAAMALLIKSIGSVVKTIAIVIGILSLLDQGKLAISAVIVGGIMVLIGAFVFLFSKFGAGKNGGLSPKQILATALVIKVIGSAIKGIAIVIGILSLLDQSKVAQAAGIVAGIIALLGLLMLVFSIKPINKSLMNTAKAMIVLSAAIAIISLAIIKLAKTDLKQTFVALTLVIGAFAAISVILIALSLFSPQLTALAVAFTLFGAAAFLFGAGVFLVISSVEKLNKMGPKAIQTMTDLITAVVINIPKWATLLITGLLNALAEMIPSISAAVVKLIIGIIEGVTNSVSNIVSAIAKLFSVIASTLASYSNSFNIKDLFWAIQSVALIAGLIFILQIISSDMGAAIKGIVLMGVVLGLLVGALVIINAFTDPSKSIEILKGMAATILSFAAIFAVLAGVTLAFDKIGGGHDRIPLLGFLKVVVAFAIALIVMVAAVAAIGILTEDLMDEDYKSTMGTAIKMMEMTGQAFGSFMGAITKTFASFVNGESIGLLLALVPLILALEPLIIALPILGEMLTVFGGILAILDKVFPEGTVVKIFKLINEIMPLLAEAIGTFLGTMIKKVLELVTDVLIDSMTKFANGMSEFMKRLQPFLDAVQQIDSTTLEKVSLLALIILEMAATNLLTSLTNLLSFLTGGSGGFIDFAATMAGMAPFLNKFSKELKDGKFDANIATRAAFCAQMLTNVANNMPKKGGLAQLFTGVSMDMNTFATKLVGLGVGLVAFAQTVSKMTDKELKAVKPAAEAVSTLAGVANKMPREGGWLQKLVGEVTDMDVFGEQMKGLGTSLKEFTKSVSGISADQYKIAKDNAVPLIQSLVDISKQMPSSGGWWQKIVGETTDIDTFGDQMEGLGSSLAQFAINTNKVSAGNVTRSGYAIDIAERLVSLASSLNDIKDGGFIGMFQGTSKEDLNSFSETLPKLGEAISSFAKATNGVENMENVNTLAQAITELSKAFQTTNGQGDFNKNFLVYIEDIVNGEGSDFKGIETWKLLPTIFGDYQPTDVWTFSQRLHKIIEELAEGMKATNGAENFTKTFLMNLERMVIGEEGIFGGAATWQKLPTIFGKQSSKTYLNIAKDMNEVITEFSTAFAKSNGQGNFSQNFLIYLEDLINGYGDDYGGVETFQKIPDLIGDKKGTDFSNAAYYARLAIEHLAAAFKSTEGMSTASTTFYQDLARFLRGDKNGYNGVEDFKAVANVLGVNIANAKNESEKIDLVCEAIKKLAETFSSMSNVDTGAMAEFVKSVNDLAGITITTLSEDILNDQAKVLNSLNTLIYNMGDTFEKKKEPLKKNVQNMASQIKVGIDLEKPNAVKSMDSLIASCLNTLNTYASTAPNVSNTFYKAGQNSVDGYIAGLKSKSEQVVGAGFDLGKLALTGTNKALDNRSPSHKYEDGVAYNGVMGFVRGFKKRMGLAFNAGSDLGQNALNGTRGIVSKISNIIDSDMNLQPIISPVLDLSEVSAQSGRINGILNTGTTISAANAASNLIEQGRMLRLDARLDQNGSPDVVAAIDTLTKRMDSLESAILNRPIELDKVKVSKELTPEIDKNLGRRAYYSRRGN